jgi:hypothetical protein
MATKDDKRKTQETNADPNGPATNKPKRTRTVKPKVPTLDIDAYRDWYADTETAFRAELKNGEQADAAKLEKLFERKRTLKSVIDSFGAAAPQPQTPPDGA